MKYQCNCCGQIYDFRQDAVNCHPDINEIPDDELESRIAAQHHMYADAAVYAAKKADTTRQPDTVKPAVSQAAPVCKHKSCA